MAIVQNTLQASSVTAASNASSSNASQFATRLASQLLGQAASTATPFATDLAVKDLAGSIESALVSLKQANPDNESFLLILARVLGEIADSKLNDLINASNELNLSSGGAKVPAPTAPAAPAAPAAPVAGAPVAGAPVAGAPVAGAPVAGAPEKPETPAPSDSSFGSDSARLTATAKIFSIVMESTVNVIKTTGDAITTAARK